MADFAALQAKFDSDPALGRRFLSDPVGVLKSEGVDVAPQQAFEIQRAVSEIGRPSGPLQAARVDVSVSVTIRF
jgi:hypothetical protein